MRTPANFRRIGDARRLTGEAPSEEACAAAAVFWDAGLVLAAFLGFSLTITAVLTIFGIS